ncbi:hypothetical protein FACS189419_06590 [Planctomycetales bacterium]|nr:hypothetical protein FACS189419_06590 [Planctomycetales bacterium]
MPERAVFFQSYPGEFSTQLVQSLGNVPKQFFLGTCCEGMFRTSKITVKELYTNFQYIHNISDEPEITAQHVLVVSAFGPFGNDAARGQFLVDEWSAKGYNTSLMTSVEEPLPVPSPLFVLDADDSPFETVLETVTHLQTKYPGNAFLIYIQSPRIHEKRALTERGVITRAK